MSGSRQGMRTETSGVGTLLDVLVVVRALQSANRIPVLTTSSTVPNVLLC